MDLDEAYDVIEELQFSLSGDALVDALRAQADALDPGAEGRASFLNVRGELLAMDDRWDEARERVRRALGLPHDRYDDAVPLVRESYRR